MAKFGKKTQLMLTINEVSCQLKAGSDSKNLRNSINCLTAIVDTDCL